MRRIVVWLASTVTVVVLLFGYHTSTDKTGGGTATTSASSPATQTPATQTPSTQTPSTQTPSTQAPSTQTPSAAPSTPSTSPKASSSAKASTTPKASSTPKATSKTDTYTGSVAQTRWGPVQVKITVTDGTITKVTVLQQPDGNPRDVEINAQALPILISDTLTAQSAKIDMVSGATVTSDGYVESLQAALDSAGI